jgi:hypothetical protein
MAREQKYYMATRLMEKYIRDLLGTGLFGDTESEVAGRLIAMGIERLIHEETIARRDAEFPEDEGEKKTSKGKTTPSKPV